MTCAFKKRLMKTKNMPGVYKFFKCIPKKFEYIIQKCEPFIRMSKKVCIKHVRKKKEETALPPARWQPGYSVINRTLQVNFEKREEIGPRGR